MPQGDNSSAFKRHDSEAKNQLEPGRGEGGWKSSSAKTLQFFVRADPINTVNLERQKECFLFCITSVLLPQSYRLQKINAQVPHFNTLNYSINLYYSSVILETNRFFCIKVTAVFFLIFVHVSISLHFQEQHPRLTASTQNRTWQCQFLWDIFSICILCI